VQYKCGIKSLKNNYLCILIENPKELMRDHIRNLMESRAFELDYPCLFDSSNIKCLFGILDASCCGHITSEQFKSGVYYIPSILSLIYN
jgi:hypothetical protein